MADGNTKMSCATVALSTIVSLRFIPISLVLQVDVVEKIENAVLNVLWQPLIPRSSPLQSGVGLNRSIYPLGFDIVYQISVDKGKIVGL